MVLVMLAGTGGWVVAGLVLLTFDAPQSWLRTCLAGVLLGLALTAAMLVRHRYRAVGRRGQDRGTSSTSASS